MPYRLASKGSILHILHVVKNKKKRNFFLRVRRSLEVGFQVGLVGHPPVDRFRVEQKEKKNFLESAEVSGSGSLSGTRGTPSC